MSSVVIHLCVCSSCEGLELLAAQSQTQDASCLPALRVSDVQPMIPVTPVQMGSLGTVPLPSRFNVSRCVLEPHYDVCLSRGRRCSVLRAAHQRPGLLPSHVQPQRHPRGAPPLHPALLCRPHPVSQEMEKIIVTLEICRGGGKKLLLNAGVVITSGEKTRSQ